MYLMGLGVICLSCIFRGIEYPQKQLLPVVTNGCTPTVSPRNARYTLEPGCIVAARRPVEGVLLVRRLSKILSAVIASVAIDMINRLTRLGVKDQSVKIHRRIGPRLTSPHILLVRSRRTQRPVDRFHLFGVGRVDQCNGSVEKRDQGHTIAAVDHRAQFDVFGQLAIRLRQRAGMATDVPNRLTLDMAKMRTRLDGDRRSLPTATLAESFGDGIVWMHYWSLLNRFRGAAPADVCSIASAFSCLNYTALADTKRVADRYQQAA